MARWIVLSLVAGCGLLACLSDPEFHQVGEGNPATTTVPSVTTPPSTAGEGVDASVASTDPTRNDAGGGGGGGGDDDGGDDATNYVPDGGIAGPGTVPCGGKICKTGFVCCSGKCKNPKGKC